MKPATTACTQILKPNQKARCAGLRNAQRRGMLKSGRNITSVAMSVTKASLKPRRRQRWQNGKTNLKNGERKNDESLYQVRQRKAVERVS